MNNEYDGDSDKEIKLGIIRGGWILWYGSPRSKNEMETIVLILMLLEKDPPSANPHWTLSDLKDNIKKTYADIQSAVAYLEESKVIETGKDWIKNQGNKRFIKVTFKGKDFMGFCRLISGKALKELHDKKIKKKTSTEEEK